MALAVKRFDPAKFNTLSRKQKRALTLSYKGEDMNVMVYIKMRAKGLPPMMNKATEVRHDHEAYLVQFYMGKGLEGINEYLTTIADITGQSVPYIQAYDIAAQEEALLKKQTGLYGADGKPILRG